jgi:hypothetical protein
LFRTIETVVEEKPLSFATSRIVTIEGLRVARRTAKILKPLIPHA